MKINPKKNGETYSVECNAFGSKFSNPTYNEHLTTKGDFNRFIPGTSNFSTVKTFSSIKSACKWMEKNMPEKEFRVQKVVLNEPFETVYEYLIK